MSQELAWLPAAVAPHVKRLADAIGEHVEATMRQAIDRAIAALAENSPVSPIVERDPKPDNDPFETVEAAIDTMLGPPNHRPPPPQQLPSQKSCSKCGYVGGNSRGCGTAHLTIVNAAAMPAPMTAIAPPRRLVPTPQAIEEMKARSKDRISRVAELAERAKSAPPRPVKPSDNPTARERWTASEIAVEITETERNKLEGSLPKPRSSFEITPRNSGDVGYGADLGDVEELDFEGQG